MNTQEWMKEYLKANRDRITFKPLYYYGDTIIGIQIEENVDGALKKYEWSVEY